MKQFTAGKNDDGVRLQRFVQSVTQGMPTSLLHKSFRNKRVKVNGKRALPDARLAEGDVIELYINDEFFAVSPQKPATRPKQSKHKMQIIYEDDAIAALYKPAHLLCHSDRTGDDSLVDQFCEYLTQQGSYRPDEEAAFRPGICNRLDRGTEGLVVGAKTYAALRDMNEVIRLDCLKKQYLCVTVGVPPKGVHTAYLRHFEKDNKVVVSSTPKAGYKEIRTGVTILKQNGPFALCKIDLLTGRTHQIRAHLSFLSAPILGDIKYGNRKMNERCKTRTQLLCAAEIEFRDIPPENTLFYLNGKHIALETPGIVKIFASL